MSIHHYIGFDVHKKSISYCVKAPDGTIVEEGKLRATRQVLREWAQKRTEAWHGAMEATLFSGWIYDALKPVAAELQMGNPSMMKAIGAAKKKNDRLDARKIADLVRCNLLPVCYVAPPEMRDLRRCLRAPGSVGYDSSPSLPRELTCRDWEADCLVLRVGRQSGVTRTYRD